MKLEINTRLIILSALFAGALIIKILLGGPNGIYSNENFVNININSKIKINRYNHGFPVVTLIDDSIKNKTDVLLLPAACSSYLRSNDSLIKTAGINELKVIRDSANFQVVTFWGDFENPELSQLIKREVAKR